MNTHILGATRMGKSKLMETLMRGHLKRKEGFCLIDPHKSLYDAVLTFAAYHKRPLNLFEAGDPFNPLAGDDISYTVDALLKCFSQVWNENAHETPLLRRCLRAVLWALAENQMTLSEALDVVNEPEAVHVDDKIYANEWAYFRSLSARDYNQSFSSTRNRLMEFLSAPILRKTFGEQVGLDIPCILQGGSLLINLESGTVLSEENSRLLGTLLVNAIFTHAKKGLSKPFYLYIDEAHLYLTPTVRDILSQASKWNLHLCLAHQHLRQFPPETMAAILGNTQQKAVFGGLSLEDANTMAETLYLGHIDLEEAKQSLVRPTLVGHETSYVSRSSYSYGFNDGTSESIADGLKTTRDADGSSSSWSTIEDERLVPIFEDRATAVFSLQEQIHKLAGAIVNQPQGTCIMKTDRPVSYQVPFVERPRIRAERIIEYKKSLHASKTLREGDSTGH